VKTVDRLINEHDLIERGISLLEQVATLMEAGQDVPDGLAAWAPEFFRQFADNCHHAKEEDLFFPLLKSRGIPEEGGPIGVMLHEHIVSRDCVRRMREAVGQNPIDSAKYVAAAREYIPLLRQHIFKENNVLFKMAENVLSESDDADLNDQFTEVEQQRNLAAMHKEYASGVSQWEERLRQLAK